MKFRIIPKNRKMAIGGVYDPLNPTGTSYKDPFAIPKTQFSLQDPSVQQTQTSEEVTSTPADIQPGLSAPTFGAPSPYSSTFQMSTGQWINTGTEFDRFQNRMTNAGDKIIEDPMADRNRLDTSSQSVDTTDQPAGTNGQNEPNAAQRTFIGMPSVDLGSRISQIGYGIGQQVSKDKDANKGLGNIVGNIALPALSAAGQIARGILTPIAQQRMNAQVKEEQRKRLAESQWDNAPALQTGADGGQFSSYGNKNFKLEDLTGENLYALPKSMQGNANLEIEGGEYYMSPDGSAPQEAVGPKHSDGGMPIDAENGAQIVSNKRNISESLAKLMADKYDIKVTEKNTYADVMDKYKKKIGLTDEYAKQESILKRIEKNEKIKDKDTVRLGESVLSKYLKESQDKIKGLEDDFALFSNIIFASQEEGKDKENTTAMFADGGVFDNAQYRELVKKYNLTDEQARQYITDYMKQNNIVMEAQGGLTFNAVQNPYNTGNNQYGWQSQGNGAYGQAVTNTAERLYELAQQFPILATGDTPILKVDSTGKTAAYTDPGMDNAALIQSRMQDVYGSLRAIAPSVRNSEDFLKYIDAVEFGGDPGTKTDPNARASDRKLGEFTSSRPSVGLSVVSEEQKKKLNDEGIYNYVQLVNNEKFGKEVLGDAVFDRLVSMKNTKGAENMDFRIEAFTPNDVMAQTPLNAPDITTNVTNPALDQKIEGLQLAVDTPKDQGLLTNGTVEEKNNEIKAAQSAQNTTTETGNGVGLPPLMFPELFRMYPSALKTESLPRATYLESRPVLRSADMYLTELGRNTEAQLNAMEGVPDSQRAAIMSNIMAMGQQEAAKYISEVDYANQAARQAAQDRTNQLAMGTDRENIAYRQQYQQGLLRAEAIQEEDMRRYVDSLNEEAQQKFNIATSMNTLQSMFPDYRMSPTGELVYTNPSGRVLSNPGRAPESGIIAAAQQQAAATLKGKTTKMTK